MIKRCRTIKENRQGEAEVKKSRFICSLKRIESEEEVESFIQKVKKRHWKADHNCSAFVIGGKGEIQHSGDDSEPSGTAGIPMLEVLKKEQLINVAAVVARYFGGTKLGTGGLIRAYTHAVSQALSDIGIIEGALQQEISVVITYPQLGKLQNYLELRHFFVKGTQYTDQITVICTVDKKSTDSFKESIIELLNGQVQFEGGPIPYREQLITNHR